MLLKEPDNIYEVGQNNAALGRLPNIQSIEENFASYENHTDRGKQLLLFSVYISPG